MKSNIVTQWFDAFICPVHIGFYEVLFIFGHTKIVRKKVKWNGVEWERKHGARVSGACGDQWRGLVNPSASGGRGR